MTEHNPPTLAEIAALTARLHVLSTTGAAADPAERAAFVADKDALIARITATEQADDSTQARAEAGGYALVGPSARTWRTDPATGQPVEPASEAEHQAVRELLGRDVLTTTEPAWTDGEVVSAVIPLADNNGYWADTASDEQIDNPAELGLTGGEGPPIDAGPALTAEEAARELAADGIPLDHARALVRSYLDDVSAHVGTPVHQWGLDEADLADIRAYAGDPGPVHDLDEGDPWADYRTYTAVEAADQLIARGIPPDRAPGIIQRYRDELTAARGEPSDVRELDDDDLTRMLAPDFTRSSARCPTTGGGAGARPTGAGRGGRAPRPTGQMAPRRCSRAGRRRGRAHGGRPVGRYRWRRRRYGVAAVSTLLPPPEPDSSAVAAGAATGSAVPDPQARVRALSRMVDRALHRIQQLETRITGLTDTLAATTAPAAGPSDGDDGDGDCGLLPPGARSWLLADDPAQADADLAELGVWLWRVYLWWPDAWLSSCWLWHPEVIEELWWLRVAHAEAYHPEAGSILRVADWHERHRPGVTRRVHHILGRCELNRHVPFNGRPVEIISPGPPALARHASAVSAVWTAGAGLDVVRAAGPEPTPEQLAEADAYQRALYGRRR